MEKIQEYFDAKNNDILTSLLQDESIGLLYAFIFDRDKNQSKMNERIYEIIHSYGDTNFEKHEIMLFLNTFLGNDDNMHQFCYDLGDVLTSEVFNSDYSGSTTKRQLMQYIQTGIFWSLFPKAIKKCLRRSDYSCTITSSIVTGYPSAVVTRCVTGFNINANTYRLANEPGLNILLHKRHYAKRPRTQKKNITRVRKQIKKVILLYKSEYPRGNAFNGRLNMLPDEFIDAVRKLFCK